MLADTHCHLNFESFNIDRPAVIERAQAAGVARILIPGIDLLSSQTAVQLAGKYEPVYAAVGIHPNDALSWNEESLAQLRLLASQSKVAAIGEIGLDYYWERSPVFLQRSILEEQLNLAAEIGIPVILHVRDKSPEDMPAMRDMLAMLKLWTAHLSIYNPGLAQRPGVLHSFSGDCRVALDAIKLNFLIGVTGPVTYRNSQRLRDVVTGVLEESLLVETDAPFLTPTPHRGKRNEPALVRIIAEKIAHIRRTNIEHLAQITTLNAERLFRW